MDSLTAALHKRLLEPFVSSRKMQGVNREWLINGKLSRILNFAAINLQLLLAEGIYAAKVPRTEGNESSTPVEPQLVNDDNPVLLDFSPQDTKNADSD
jgi:hypothetical protein